MNLAIIKQSFPEAYARMLEAQCPTCGTPITGSEFRDALSVKEFAISGMCQKCQNETFTDQDGEVGGYPVCSTCFNQVCECFLL